MTTMQFIASLVGSLVWPIAVVAIAVIFRAQIRQLLTRPVSGVRVGPFEMKWDLERVEVAASVGPQPMAPTQSGSKPEPAVVEVLADTVTTSPIGAVLEAHAAIERELRVLVADEIPDSNVSRMSMRQLLRLALDHGIITPETFNAVDGITIMRNLAAHGQPNEVTPERARDYLTLADAVLYTFRQKSTP